MESLAQELQRVARVLVRENEPLARHTTLRIGGPAEFFASVSAVAELISLVSAARAKQIPIFLLGSGSNLLVRDGGIRGLVIVNRCRAFEIVQEQQKGILRAESGAPLPFVANQASRQGWSGLEWGIGVPGTIGGAVIGNAGAHGGEIANTLTLVSVIDPDGIPRELPKSKLGFDYRTSILKETDRWIVLSALFELYRDDPKACIARMNDYTEHRRRTQPTQASVGSIFKNPPGRYAGQLVEEAGLKGKRVGDAEISSTHANFIINHGRATADQVLELINLAQRVVQDRTGMTLELEIQVVGD